MSRQVVDNSSPELRALRESYCEHFLRTGEIDPGLYAKLEALVVPLRGLDALRPRRSRGSAPCIVPGCGELNIAKGLCRKHYSAQAYQKRKEKQENEKAMQVSAAWPGPARSALQTCDGD